MEHAGSTLKYLPKSARYMPVIAAIILTAASLAMAAAAGPQGHLVYAGGAPKPPQLKATVEKDKRVFHVTIRPIFKNVSSTPGRVDRVAVVPMQLSPEAIRVVYFDQSAVGWLEEKEIRCEFLVVLDSKISKPAIPLEFRLYFYAPDGREIYWEGIMIDPIPSRPS